MVAQRRVTQALWTCLLGCLACFVMDSFAQSSPAACPLPMGAAGTISGILTDSSGTVLANLTCPSPGNESLGRKTVPVACNAQTKKWSMSCGACQISGHQTFSLQKMSSSGVYSGIGSCGPHTISLDPTRPWTCSLAQGWNHSCCPRNPYGGYLRPGTMQFLTCHNSFTKNYGTTSRLLCDIQTGVWTHTCQLKVVDRYCGGGIPTEYFTVAERHPGEQNFTKADLTRVCGLFNLLPLLNTPCNRAPFCFKNTYIVHSSFSFLTINSGRLHCDKQAHSLTAAQSVGKQLIICTDCAAAPHGRIAWLVRPFGKPTRAQLFCNLGYSTVSGYTNTNVECDLKTHKWNDSCSTCVAALPHGRIASLVAGKPSVAHLFCDLGYSTVSGHTNTTMKCDMKTHTWTESCSTNLTCSLDDLPRHKGVNVLPVAGGITTTRLVPQATKLNVSCASGAQPHDWLRYQCRPRDSTTAFWWTSLSPCLACPPPSSIGSSVSNFTVDANNTIRAMLTCSPPAKAAFNTQHVPVVCLTQAMKWSISCGEFALDNVSAKVTGLLANGDYTADFRCISLIPARGTVSATCRSGHPINVTCKPCNSWFILGGIAYPQSNGRSIFGCSRGYTQYSEHPYRKLTCDTRTGLTSPSCLATFTPNCSQPSSQPFDYIAVYHRPSNGTTLTRQDVQDKCTSLNFVPLDQPPAACDQQAFCKFLSAMSPLLSLSRAPPTTPVSFPTVRSGRFHCSGGKSNTLSPLPGQTSIRPEKQVILCTDCKSVVAIGKLHSIARVRGKPTKAYLVCPTGFVMTPGQVGYTRGDIFCDPVKRRWTVTCQSNLTCRLADLPIHRGVKLMAAGKRVPINTRLNVTCAEGFELLEALRYQCQGRNYKLAVWSTASPCKALPDFCPQFPFARANVIRRRVPSRMVGTKFLGACHHGYDFTSTDAIVCESHNRTHGQWKYDACIKISNHCPKFHFYAGYNPSSAPATFDVDTQFIVQCRQGYHLYGSDKVKCIGNSRHQGLWQHNSSCERHLSVKMSTVGSNSQVQFICNITGNLIQDIEWTWPGGKAINASATNVSITHWRLSTRALSKLSFVVGNSTQLGEYGCSGRTRYQHISDNLTLRASMLKPQLLTRTRSFTARPGLVALLGCSFSGYFPGVVTWAKDGKPLIGLNAKHQSVNGVRKSQITFTVDQVEKAGRYKCAVSSPFGLASATISLYVKPENLTVAGKTVLRRRSIVINCTFDGYLRQAPAWTLPNGQNLSHSTNHTSIFYHTLFGAETRSTLRSSVKSFADIGTYTCTGVGVSKTVSEHFHLSNAHFEPRRLLKTKKHAGRPGHITELGCTFGNEVDGRISWTKEGRPASGDIHQQTVKGQTTSATKSTLRFRVLEIHQAGNYVCTAINMFGLSSMVTSLTVAKENLTVVGQSSVTNVHVEFNCTFKGFVRAFPVWTLPNGRKVIKPGLGVIIRDWQGHGYVYSILKFHVSPTSNIGQYTCTAAGVSQSVSKSFTVSPSQWPVKLISSSKSLGPNHTPEFRCVFTRLVLSRPVWTLPSGEKVNATGDGITIHDLIHGSHIVSVMSLPLDATSPGQYTCSGDGFGQTVVTATLTVAAREWAPSLVWTDPSFVTEVGLNVSARCSMSGYLANGVIWRYGQQVVDSTLITSVVNNGTTTSTVTVAIQSGVPVQELLCSGSNPFGSVLGRITLTIDKKPPVVVAVSPDRDVFPGDNDQLNCTFSGFMLGNITWSRVDNATFTGTVEQTVSAGSVTSILTLNSTSGDTAGQYRCTARDATTSTNKIITLSPLGTQEAGEAKSSMMKLAAALTGSGTLALLIVALVVRRLKQGRADVFKVGRAPTPDGRVTRSNSQAPILGACSRSNSQADFRGSRSNSNAAILGYPASLGEDVSIAGMDSDLCDEQPDRIRRLHRRESESSLMSTIEFRGNMSPPETVSARVVTASSSSSAILKSLAAGSIEMKRHTLLSDVPPMPVLPGGGTTSTLTFADVAEQEYAEVDV